MERNRRFRRGDNPGDRLLAVLAVILAVAVIVILVLMMVENRFGTKRPPENTGTAEVSATEAGPETDEPSGTAGESDVSAPDSTAEEPSSAEVTTADPTEKQTTEAVTTAAETKDETTKAAVTTAEETSAGTEAPPTLRYLTSPVEGAVLVGVSDNGFAIEEKDGKTYVGGVLIANKTYSLPANYDPGDLTEDARAAFNAMQEAGRQAGVYFKIQSGYRDYALQKSLYENYVYWYGYAYAEEYSAHPGHSEHQSGLAMDINQDGTWTLDETFENTAEGKWLAEHCHEYGYILRYMKGKTGVTGYIYEPWHFRYIGVEAAKKVAESGLTLEEYFGITSVYPE